jgi:hypothetical protein
MCETGGARRSWLRGLVNVRKRYSIAAAAQNLGRLLRRLFGRGKPKAPPGEGGLAALARLLMTPLRTAWGSLCFVFTPRPESLPTRRPHARPLPGRNTDKQKNA